MADIQYVPPLLCLAATADITDLPQHSFLMSLTLIQDSFSAQQTRLDRKLFPILLGRTQDSS